MLPRGKHGPSLPPRREDYEPKCTDGWFSSGLFSRVLSALVSFHHRRTTTINEPSLPIPPSSEPVSFIPSFPSFVSLFLFLSFLLSSFHSSFSDESCPSNAPRFFAPCPPRAASPLVASAHHGCRSEPQPERMVGPRGPPAVYRLFRQGFRQKKEKKRKKRIKERKKRKKCKPSRLLARLSPSFC
jgi:hypothetical protein